MPRQAPNVRLIVVDPASGPALLMLDRYYGHLAAALPGGFDPPVPADSDAAQFRPPAGVFLVAVDQQDVPLGCGALRHLDAGTAEVKRMYVDPDARGKGVGSRLLRALEDEARRSGRRSVRLDTSAELPAALALYLRSGYASIDRYNDNPHAAYWLERQL